MKRILLLLVALSAVVTAWSVFDASSTPASAVGSTGLYSPIAPFRAIDTRPGLTPAGQTLIVSVGAPSGAVAAAVNITIAENRAPGFLAAWSGVGGVPSTSIINTPNVGDAIANFAIVPVGPGGTIGIFASMTSGIIVDVMGYVTSSDPTPVSGINALVTGYDGQSGQFAFTNVIGTVSNGTGEEVDVRVEVPCGNGLTATDIVFGLGAGQTLGWSVLCDDIFFTSGAVANVTLI